MKRLLWINACMRGAGQSRTYALCKSFLDGWRQANPEGEVLERDLTGCSLKVMDARLNLLRDRAVEEGEMDSYLLELPRELAEADCVVVGAPYWDLSFPAQLKVYLEWASTLGVTFRYTESGQPEGLCKADKLLYITTAGGPVQGQNFGFDYVKALAAMLGIGQAECVAAENLDVWDGPGPENIRRAEEQLRRMAENW